MRPRHGGAPELAIQVFADPDLYVIRLAGELDLASADAVETALLDAERRARSNVLVDLEGLRFIDSTGMRLLLQAKRRAEDDGLVLRVTGAQGAVARVLRLTGIESELAFEPRVAGPAPGPGGGSPPVNGRD